jgi:hypothetical protein
MAVTENGWGKERKINGELALLILVAGGEGGLKQNLWKIILYTRNFSLYCCVRYSDIQVVWVLNIPTSNGELTNHNNI